MTGDSRAGNAVLESDGSFRRRSELRALLLAAADTARRGRGASRARSAKASGTIRERVALLLSCDAGTAIQKEN